HSFQGGNGRCRAESNQRQRECAAPRFGYAIGQKQTDAECQSRSSADDKPQQWTAQDETVHVLPPDRSRRKKRAGSPAPLSSPHAPQLAVLKPSPHNASLTV